MSAVYSLNKNINKPVSFKGLKAQYIWYLGGGLLLLLIFFAILYICGVNPLACLVVIVLLGTLFFVQIYRLSHKYGEHGMMKRLAKKGIPKMLKAYSRHHFIKSSH
jgi:4-hydroxybenzoate polyprenyltransferase